MYAVIRIRGSAAKRYEMNDALEMMRLKSPNNCVLLPENAEAKGMLAKVKDLATWGEVDKETLVKLLQKRLRLKGKKRIGKNIKAATGHDSFEKLAEEIMNGKLNLKNLDKVTPYFRLTPPSKGLKSAKLPYPKGDLGYRGKEINKLLERMI